MTEATPEQLTLRSQRMGALPLLGFFLSRMGLAERLQSYLPRGDARLRLAPAAVIGVVVRNILVARRPLCGLAEWALPMTRRCSGWSPATRPPSTTTAWAARSTSPATTPRRLSTRRSHEWEADLLSENRTVSHGAVAPPAPVTPRNVHPTPPSSSCRMA